MAWSLEIQGDPSTDINGNVQVKVQLIQDGKVAIDRLLAISSLDSLKGQVANLQMQYEAGAQLVEELKVADLSAVQADIETVKADIIAQRG